MAFDAGSLIANLRLNSQGFVTGLSSAERAVKGVAKESGTTTEAMSKLDKASALLSTTMGKTLAIGAVGGLILGFKKTVDSAGDLEKSMANVATLVDTTTVSIQGLTEEVLEMTTTVNKSSEDLSAGLYQVFSAGVTDSAEAMQVLEASAIAATAGLSDTRTSVDAITTVINAYGLAASDATEISDLMFKTVALGKTTFSELAGAIGTVIAPAASLGVELEDLFAAIATLTKGGIDTRTTMTALRGVLFSILKPSDEAKETAKELGIEWSAAAIKAKGLIAFLNDMKDATQGNSDTIAKLIPERQALNAVLALTGSQIEELNGIFGQMEDAMGSTRDAFKKQEETYEVQSQKLGLLVDKMQIKIGSVFLPAITGFLKGTLSFFQVVGDEIDKIQAKLSAPKFVGPATVDQIKAAASAIGKPFEKLTEEDIPKLENKLKELFGTTLPKLSSGMVQTLKKSFDTATKTAEKSADDISTAWSKIPDNVKEAFETLGVLPKEQLASQVQELSDAFNLLTTEQDLSQQEVIRLREGLFQRLKDISESADSDIIALGFDPEKLRISVDELHQQLLSGTTETITKLQEEGNTVTIVAKGQIKATEDLVTETLNGLDDLIISATKTQASSFDVIMKELEIYKNQYITAEMEITEIVAQEVQERAMLFDRFVQDAEGKWLRLQSTLNLAAPPLPQVGNAGGETNINQNVNIFGTENSAEAASQTTRSLDKFNAGVSF